MEQWLAAKSSQEPKEEKTSGAGEPQRAGTDQGVDGNQGVRKKNQKGVNLRDNPIKKSRFSKLGQPSGEQMKINKLVDRMKKTEGLKSLVELGKIEDENRGLGSFPKGKISENRRYKTDTYPPVVQLTSARKLSSEEEDNKKSIS